MIETDCVFACGRTPPAVCRTGLCVIPNCGRVGSIHLPTPSVTTAAFKSVLNESRVSEFTGCTGRTLQQLMIKYQTATDTFRDRYNYQITQSLSAATEADFGKCTGICRIF